ncbi:hypothetical protein BpHYR1_010115 [Brachionus plicatilis]|uniref:Uncharacterized protein n=1 Tax=Brachionus plicatilis TaxID=10195 RepID=A0A3M7PQB9_BRAPC|nr:hypothetical protein BpHYR1_010115 [Brachionus plicatilis]
MKYLSNKCVRVITLIRGTTLNISIRSFDLNDESQFKISFLIMTLYNFQSCICYQGLQNSNLAEIRFQCVKACSIYWAENDIN